MRLKPFQLERYFAKYEFSVKYLLSPSDSEPLEQKELLKLADKRTKALWEDLKLSYTDSQGHPLLREEISKLYKKIKPEDILVIAPEEGIFIAMNALLDKGDHVICTFPGYQSLYEIAEGIGCEVTKWAGNEEEEWRFDPEFLVKNIRKNTKLIVVNFAHNPTGYLPSKKDFKRIIEIAKEHNLYVFSDEMYQYLEYDAQDRLDSACDLYDKAVCLFGVSKTFGLPGLRIGWLVSRNKELLNNLKDFKDYTTICSSAPSEILALIALRAKDKIIRKHLKRIEKNIQYLERFFEKYSDLFSWVKPKAGTICFPKIRFNKSSSEFCEDVVSKAGIMILPSTVYDFDDKHFRIGFGRDNFIEVMEEFERYIKKNISK